MSSFVNLGNEKTEKIWKELAPILTNEQRLQAAKILMIAFEGPFPVRAWTLPDEPLFEEFRYHLEQKEKGDFTKDVDQSVKPDEIYSGEFHQGKAQALEIVLKAVEDIKKIGVE